MKVKNWRLFAIVFSSIILVTVAYYVGKHVGKNSAEIRLAEQELAFQKKKEATRIAEYKKEMKLREEERVERQERLIMQAAMQNKAQENAMKMQLVQAMMKANQYPPKKDALESELLFYKLVEDYLAANPKEPPASKK